MSEEIGEQDIHSLEERKSKSSDNVELRTSGPKTKADSKIEMTTMDNVSGNGADVLKSTSVESTAEENIEGADEEAERRITGNLPELISYIKMLDAPRKLPVPLDITFDYLKEIFEELGLIKLCWPVLTNVTFEERTNFPESYLKNSNKENLLLLYAENFRRQFCYHHPDRKPLFLACDNECGMQKMVCTTIRPTTLPYSELDTWEKCSRFVADHLRYEPLEEPVLICLGLLTVQNSMDHLSSFFQRPDNTFGWTSDIHNFTRWHIFQFYCFIKDNKKILLAAKSKKIIFQE